MMPRVIRGSIRRIGWACAGYACLTLGVSLTASKTGAPGLTCLAVIVLAGTPIVAAVASYYTHPRNSTVRTVAAVAVVLTNAAAAFTVLAASASALPSGWVTDGLTASLIGTTAVVALITLAAWVKCSFVFGRALTLVRRFPAPHECQHCGYDLTGNVSGRCPECGTPSEREEETA